MVDLDRRSLIDMVEGNAAIQLRRWCGSHDPKCLEGIRVTATVPSRGLPWMNEVDIEATIGETEPAAEVSAGPHDSVVLRLPSLGRLARHALPSVLEGAVGPVAVFYVVLVLFGFRGALIAAALWSCLAAARRLARRERLPALLVLGLLLLAVRTSIAFLTGSAFFYFMQPALGTFLVGLLFAGSALLKRPIIERLATEFCPLDGDLMARPCMRRFFLRLSALWCAVMTVNAGLALYFLVETSLRAFLVERAVVSYTLTLGGVLVSTGWFVLSMRKAGIAVRFRQHRGVAVENAAA